MTRPYITIIDAVHEYRNDHIDRPDVIYVGTEFMERLESSDEFFSTSLNGEHGAPVQVMGIDLHLDPSITGIRMPVEYPGERDFYYP